jgi:hypothetical protein
MDIRDVQADIYGYDLSSSILAFEEGTFENEELDESKNDGNGICLGTVFVAFTMIGTLVLRLTGRGTYTC